MAADPNELAEVYSRFEKAHAAGDYKAAKELKTYAEQLEGMASGGGALPSTTPDEAGPALSAEPASEESGGVRMIGGRVPWKSGGVTAMKVGATRMVSNYLSSRERERQQREKAVEHVKSRMPQEWLPEFDKIHNKSDFRALDQVARIRFGKKYDELIAQEEQNPAVADLIKQARDSDATTLYDSIIRPYFSKDGPDLAADWEEKIEKVRGEFTEKQRAAIDKPWLSENAEFFKPGSWFDETTKAPWHDPQGFYLSVAEQVPNLAPSIIAARGGGTLGARGALGLIKGATGRNIELIRKVAGRGAAAGGTVAGTITEGVMIRDQVGQEVYDRMMDLDDDTWKTSEDYQRLRDGGLTDTEAKQIVSTDTSMKAGNTAMVVSGVMGAPASAYFGSLGSGLASRSFVKNTVKGALMEAGPEGVQEATESIIGNLGVRRVDPDQDVFEGAGEAFVGGAFTSAPIGALGGMTESRKGSGISKENQATLEAITPWEKAASARWKLQNRLSNDELVKNHAPEEILSELSKLEDLQQKEATAFLKAEPVMRRSMIKNNAPDEDLKRLDIMKASANTMLARVAKTRETRTDARKEAEVARKEMKERQEIVDAVEKDVLKRDDLNRIAMNIERVRDQEALSEAEYAELEELGYGKFVDNDSRFHITQKGVRAIPELMNQMKRAQARVEGLYTGEERRKDSKLRERYENMTPEQREDAIYRDPTTKTLNRRAFDEAEAEKPAAAYAEVDVDSLKWVNDNMSVEAGDKLIKRVAEVLNEQEGVTAYRVGGDEFVVTGESPEAVEQAMKQAAIELDDSRVIVHENDSIMPQMTWAVGSSREEASKQVKRVKGEREKKGKRAARGEKPPSYKNVLQGIMFKQGDGGALSQSGGVTITEVETPEKFPANALIVPKDLYEQIDSKKISFTTDGDGRLALPWRAALDIWNDLKTGNNFTAFHVVNAARNFTPSHGLKLTTVKTLLDEESQQHLKGKGTITAQDFTKILWGIHLYSSEVEEASGVGSPAMRISPKSGGMFMLADGFAGGMSEDGNLSFHVKDGGYPRADDRNPGTMPRHQLIVPKALFDQMPDIVDLITFTMDKNGQTAIPAMDAAEIYEQLMRDNGLDSDNAIASITHTLVGGPKLRVGTITNMLRTRSPTATVSVRAFNSMLQGINMLANNLDATSIMGNPAYALYPSRALERQPRRYPVQGNIWDDNYGLSRDDNGDLGYPEWYGSKSNSWSTKWSGSSYSSYKWKPTYVIDWDTVALLKTKKLIAIWCNADDFFKDHKLPGFSTGMFVSEMAEARVMKVDDATQADVDQSNELFAYIANKYIDQDGDALYDLIMADYARLGGENPVVKYNIKEMETARGIIRANPPATESAGVKTLVIHPKDSTTDFLKPIYDGHPDWTVVTGDKHLGEIKELIESHDRIIMMGHGSSGGLMGVSQFENAPSPAVAAAVEAGKVEVVAPSKQDAAPSLPRASEQTMDRANKVKTEIVAQLGGILPAINLHASAADIPPSASQRILAEGSHALFGVQGFFDEDDGSIHVVVGNITKLWWASYSKENLLDMAIAEVIFHELIGHYGLRGLIGDQEALDAMTAEIREGFPDDERLRVNQMAQLKNMDPEDVRKNPALMSMVGEEIFAYRAGQILAQKYVGMTRKQHGAYERAIDKLRLWLVKHGFGKWIRMNERDLTTLVAHAENFVKKGATWSFLNRNGVRQLVEMRDANIFQTGLRRIIENGVQPNPVLKDKQARRKLEAEGQVVPETVPLFKETGSIRGYYQAFKLAISTKQLTQLELDESAVVETLLPNPVGWALDALKVTDVQFAKDSGIPLADLKKLMAPGAQIPEKVATAIAAYLKTPGIFTANISRLANELSVDYSDRVTEAAQRDSTRASNDVNAAHKIAAQEIEAEWRAQNHGRLSAKAFQLGTAMTCRDLQNLMAQMRQSSTEPDYSDLEVFKDYLPGESKQKYIEFMERVEAAKRTRRKRPDKSELEDILNDVVDPSKVSLSREMMRNIIEQSALSEVLVWPVKADDPTFADAYKRVTGSAPASRLMAAVDLDPELKDKVEAELARMKEDGYDAGFDPALNQWFESPIHKQIPTTSGDSRGWSSFTPYGQSNKFQAYLFWEKRKAQGRWQSGHYAGTLPPKHAGKLAPGTKHFSHLRIGITEDGDPNPKAAPNPAMNGKALAAIEFQSDAFQQSTGGFRDSEEHTQALNERIELLDTNKIAQRAVISAVRETIAEAVRAKAILAKTSDTVVDNTLFDGLIAAELMEPMSNAFRDLNNEVATLAGLRLSRVDARAIERINALPMRRFMESLNSSVTNGLQKAKEAVWDTASTEDELVAAFTSGFNRYASQHINGLTDPDDAKTYALTNMALLEKQISQVYGAANPDIGSKAAAAGKSSSMVMTIPREIVKDAELSEFSARSHGGSGAQSLTQYVLNHPIIASSKHSGVAYGRISPTGEAEIIYLGNDPNDFKQVYERAAKAMLDDWANKDFQRRESAASRDDRVTFERKPTMEEFFNWLGFQETTEPRLKSRYSATSPDDVLYEGKMPVAYDEDGAVTLWTSAVMRKGSRDTRIFFGFDSNDDYSYTLARAGGTFVNHATSRSAWSDDIPLTDPIPAFVQAAKKYMRANGRSFDPNQVPWREGGSSAVEPKKNMSPFVDRVMAAAQFTDKTEEIDAQDVAKRIRQLTVRLAAGISPNSIMGKADRWKVAQLRFLISHAVRNGFSKVQWASGDASTKRGGTWQPIWKPYDRITWSVEPLVIGGEAKDHIIIRANKDGATSSYAVTKDNLPVLVGSDAAVYIEQQMARKKAPVSGGEIKPSRADLVVYTMGDQKIVTRRGSNKILASIPANEDLDAKLDELVKKASSTPRGWDFAETGASPTVEASADIEPFQDRGQQWGEVHQADIGGPIQILTLDAGTDWGGHSLERPEVAGSRTAYDTILPRLFGKEIAKYGGVLKKGSMKIDRDEFRDALASQGMHRAAGVVSPSVHAAIGTPEVVHLSGESDGYVVMARDGLMGNTVYPTQQEAQRALNVLVVEKSRAEPTVPVSVWEFEITDEMRRVFGQPVAPFMYDPYADPLIKSAAEKIGAREPSFTERYKQWRAQWKDSFIQGALDRFHGIKKAFDDAGLSDAMAEVNGYIQARLSTSLDSMMKSIMLYGHPVWRDGIMQTEGEGLKDVLGEVADNLDLWAMYMAGVRAKRLLTGGSEAIWREVLNPNTSAKRKAEIIKNGRERNWTPEMIERMVHLGEVYPAFGRTAERYAAFHKKVLDFAQEAGTINPETRAVWENADYIPFYRVQDDRIIGPMSSTSGIANVSSPVKTLKGGTENVGDLMHNIMINLTKLVDGAAKNHAALTTVDALRPSGIVSNQPMAWSEQVIPMEQVKKALKERGVDPDTIPPEALTGFQKMFALQAPKGDGIISVMRNGKKEFYFTADPLLYRAMTAINKQFFGNWMNMLRAPKRLLTTWITLDPGFMIANYLRDALSSFVISRDNVVPMVGGVVGFAKALGTSEEMRIMMSSGAAFENGYINQYDPESTKRLMKRTLDSAKPGDIVLDSPRKLYELWKRIGAATENANRIAVYRAAIAAGKSKAQAAYESKDLMDFSMSGDWPVIQFLVQTVPFLGARIQGLHRLGRSFNEHPVATTLKGTLVGMAGMALWLAFKDDERYKELEDWDKDTYFHFWIGENHYRLPKPFEVGAIFNTIPERIFEAMYSKETDAGKLLMRRFGFVISEMFNMNPIPQAAQPMVESWFNYNFFTRSQIESPYEEQRLPPERYRHTTSPTMIEIARHLPAGLDTVSGKIRSPLQLQNLYLGYTGTLGRYFLMGADALVREAMDLPAPPEKTVADYPVIGRFVRGSEPRRTRYEEEFYNTLRRAIQVQGSVSFLKDASEDERMEYVEGKYEPLIEVSKELESMRKQVSRINKEMREIHLDREMDPQRKRTEVNSLQDEKNEIFKEAYDLRPGGKENMPAITPDKISFFIENFNRDEPSPELMKAAPATADLLTNVGGLSGKQLQSLARASGEE